MNIVSVKINGTGAISARENRSRCTPAEGFKGHVATGGSLLRNDAMWGACGWAVVQKDHDEEMGPLLGMYGSVEAEFEVLTPSRGRS